MTRVKLPGVLLLVLTYSLACANGPPCPPEEERFRPAIGPEGAWIQVEFDAEGQVIAINDWGDVPCPGGKLYPEVLDNPDFELVTCAGSWCGAEYIDPLSPATYCINQEEFEEWRTESCWRCDYTLNSHYYPGEYVECDPG